MKLYLYEIAEVLSAKNDVTQFENVPLRNAEFDSRLIEPGGLFVPLKGARDGHDFIATAFTQGAAATLSERPVAEGAYILVDDVLTAFQRLAKYYLEKTQGNYNNEIGLPYTVLHMPEDTEKLVLEMGQDHLGDIHLLSELAKPKTGIVTLVGEAHLEFFGSRTEIAQGKMQIADGLRKDGLLIVPADKIVNEFLPADCKLVRFGPDADIFLTRLEERKDSLSFECNFLEQRIDLPVTGKYNATNAMIAAYAALQEGVSEADIAQAFSELELTRNRTEWKKAGNGADILSDVYNANPTAMRLILETFSTIPANPGGRKLAVLADMKELGADAKSMHGSMITSLNPEIVTDLFLYGQDMEALYDYAKEIYPPGKVHYFIKNDEKDQFEQLTKAVREKLTPADQILLKGSNSMNLAKLVEDLEDGN